MRRYVGARCGASSRLTRPRSRSASPMITCVYSTSCGRSSSRSSSCAAPRMPPSGFLISCARLRISSRFACCCSCSRSSRAIFSCWSMCRNSSSSAASPVSIGETVHVRCSLALPTTPSSSSCSVYDAPVALALARSRARAPCDSPNTCGQRWCRQLAARQLEQVLGGRIRVDDRGRASSSISTAVASRSSPRRRQRRVSGCDGNSRKLHGRPHGDDSRATRGAGVLASAAI